MSRTVVGVDIGATGIRAVEATTSGRSLHVRRAGAVPLPTGVVVGGVIKDPAQVTSALKALWRKARFSTRNVATVVGADPAVLIRSARVPYMASAADRECVDAVVAAIEGAGLRPVSIDITAFALTRFVSMAASGPGHLDVIAHIGAHTISLIGVGDGQPKFQRALNEFSSAKVTSAVQETLGCPLDVAENLKITVARLQGPEAPVVNEVVAVWTTATVNAIKSALVNASRQSNTPIGRVWLSGGGARLATLAPQLKAQLGQSATVAILEPATWVTKPDKLVKATESSGQDFTVALAASSR